MYIWSWWNRVLEKTKKRWRERLGVDITYVTYDDQRQRASMVEHHSYVRMARLQKGTFHHWLCHERLRFDIDFWASIEHAVVTMGQISRMVLTCKTCSCCNTRLIYHLAHGISKCSIAFRQQVSGFDKIYSCWGESWAESLQKLAVQCPGSPLYYITTHYKETMTTPTTIEELSLLHLLN